MIEERRKKRNLKSLENYNIQKWKKKVERKEQCKK